MSWDETDLRESLTKAMYFYQTLYITLIKIKNEIHLQLYLPGIFI